MKQIGKKALALFVALAFVISLLPMAALAATYGPTDQTPANGEKYLVVAKSGNNYYALKNNNGQVASVSATVSGTTATISDAEDANCTWTMEVSGSNIKMKNGSYYLGLSGNTLQLNSTGTNWLRTSNTKIWDGTIYHYLNHNGSNFEAGYGGYTPTGMSDISFYKVSAAPSHSITVNPTQNGTVTAPASASEGDTVNLTVTPATGYMLDTLSVTSEGNPVPVNNNSFTMPAGDVTISATFVVAPTYSITVSPTPTNGTVTPSKATAMAGETITLNVTPAAGYALDTLSVTSGGSPVTVTGNTFTMPAGDVTISATFKSVPTYERTNSIENGKKYLIVSSNSANATAYALTRNINSTNAGVTQVTISGSRIQIDNANLVWEATASGNNFTLKNTAGGSTSYIRNSSNNLRIEESNPTAWTWNSSNNRLSNSNRYLRYSNGAFSLSSTASSIYFYKEVEQVYDITITSATHGTVTTDPSGSAAAGAQVNIRTTADDGYRLSSVSVTKTASGDPVTVDNNTFQMPAEPVTVTATFEQIPTHTITYSSGANGSVTGPTSAPEGSTVNLTVTPAEGYELNVLSVTSGGSPVEVNDNSFIMPNGDVTVSATFKKQTSKTYERVSTITAGKNYLIVSSNTAGSAYALQNNSNSVGRAEVTIADDKITVNDNTLVWKLEGTTSSFTLLNGDNSYLQKNSSNNLAIGNTAHNWTWQYSVPMSGDRALTYNNGFTLTYVPYEAAIANNKVYFFEEAASIDVESVTLNKATLTLSAGDVDDTLTATVSPAEATDKEVTWTSSNTSVATVDEDGVVTAIGEGTANITATAGGVDSDPCVVTVTAPYEKVKIYTLVSAPTNGKNYLIASINSAGDGFVLKNNNNTKDVQAITVRGTGVGTATITLNDSACVWKMSGDATEGFYLINDTDKYLYDSGNDLMIGNNTSYTWHWDHDAAMDTGRNTYLGYDETHGFAMENASGVDYSKRAYFFEETSSVAVPSFVGHQLILSGQIGVRFAMDLSMLDAEQLAASSLEFTFNDPEHPGTTHVIPATEATVEGGRHIFTCYVNSLQLAETITATFTYDTDKTVTNEYSVEDYINYVVEHESSYGGPTGKLVVLVKSIADYGYYAQAYSSAEHHWTIGGKYAAMSAHYTESYNHADVKDALLPFKSSVSRGSSNLNKMQLKLSLDSETALNMRLGVSTGALTGTAIFKGNTSTFTYDGEEFYEASVGNISALQLGDPITISGTAGQSFSGTVTALSFAYTSLNNSSSSTALKNVVSALYYYYKATTEYAGR